MTRSRVIQTLTASLLFVALPLIAVAAEPAAAPPGLRILYSGDSWHRFLPSLMERIGAAAGITDQKLTVGWALNTGGYGKLGTVLDEGTFDAMSWGRPGWDQGGLQQFLGQGVIDKGLKNNRQFRFYVQMAWNVSDGRGGIKTVADYDASNLADVQAAYDRGRKGVEALADEINAKQSRRVMFLVPVGEAVTKLRGMIVEGKVPGVERQSQVFTFGATPGRWPRNWPPTATTLPSTGRRRRAWRSRTACPRSSGPSSRRLPGRRSRSMPTPGSATRSDGGRQHQRPVPRHGVSAGPAGWRSSGAGIGRCPS